MGYRKKCIYGGGGGMGLIFGMAWQGMRLVGVDGLVSSSGVA
jgi:hypothetical protein